jgi:hypothetical protein
LMLIIFRINKEEKEKFYCLCQTSPLVFLFPSIGFDNCF